MNTSRYIFIILALAITSAADAMEPCDKIQNLPVGLQGAVLPIIPFLGHEYYCLSKGIAPMDTSLPIMAGKLIENAAILYALGLRNVPYPNEEQLRLGGFPFKLEVKDYKSSIKTKAALKVAHDLLERCDLVRQNSLT